MRGIKIKQCGTPPHRLLNSPEVHNNIANTRFCYIGLITHRHFNGSCEWEAGLQPPLTTVCEKYFPLYSYHIRQHVLTSAWWGGQYCWELFKVPFMPEGDIYVTSVLLKFKKFLLALLTSSAEMTNFAISSPVVHMGLPCAARLTGYTPLVPVTTLQYFFKYS